MLETYTEDFTLIGHSVTAFSIFQSNSSSCHPICSLSTITFLHTNEIKIKVTVTFESIHQIDSISLTERVCVTDPHRRQ